MKIDPGTLFDERLKRFTVELVRYSQYMANGGVLFFTIFLSGILAFYYKSFVDMIPEWLPIPYFLALVIAFFVTRSPHRTFLLEADLLFLTPIETKMGSYFQKAQRYNFFMQAVGVGVILVLLLPLYTGTMRVEVVQLWLYWCAPLLLKGWNVYSSWIFLRLPDRKSQSTYTLVRFTFTFFVLAWILSEGRFLAYHHVQYGGFVCMILLVWFHLRLQTVKNRYAIQWYRLLEAENALRSRFYRIVNNFTDIPSLQHQVKPRAWLNPIAKVIPYRQSIAARHLFVKTFLRTGDFAGVYFRLVVLGSLLILFLPNPYVKVIVAVLFLLISYSQLKGIWKLHDNPNRFSLLPINTLKQKQSFQWVCLVLLVIQGTVNLLVGLL